MQQYTRFADLEYAYEGSNDMRYYHHELDRYIIFDSEKEFKDTTKGLTYQKGPNGGFGSYVDATGNKVLSVATAGGYERPVTLLNTSILTGEGNYSYRLISLERAQQIAKSRKIESAIGHTSTAAILQELLNIHVEVNRVSYQQKPGHSALVFKLKGRPPEGVILSLEELKAIGYEFGVLTRLEDDEQKATDQTRHQWRDV